MSATRIHWLSTFFGRTPLTGEVGGELKKSRVSGKMCLCKTVHQSQWTRRKYFARIRCVLQEAKAERAISSSMIGKGNAIAAKRAKQRSAPDEEPCWRACANRWISS